MSKSKNSKTKKNHKSKNSVPKSASAYKAQAKAQGKKEKGGIVAYFKGVKQELKKVVWMTKDELLSSTVVVFGVCAFFALSFWLIDTGFLAVLRQILGISLS